MTYYIFGGLILVLVLWAVGSYFAVSNLEEPSFEVTERVNGYEVRQYQPYIIAETEVRGDYSRATNEGFRIIADYIFGNNTSRESISMTTPVLEERQSEKIAMTTPVINSLEGEETRAISFVLPSKYTMETLPTPNNDRVTLREVEAKKKAVLSFTWYATASRVEVKKAELLKRLEADGRKIIGEVQVARYNPPLSMPLVLRNEIIVEIE